MFRSLKNRIELQGEFFFFLAHSCCYWYWKEKKNIHSECEISFLCGGRQSGSQCPSWLRRCGPAWHLGANAAERWQADSAVVVALRQGHQTQMNSQSLLFWLRFVYKPECRRLLCAHRYSRVLPRGCGLLGTTEAGTLDRKPWAKRYRDSQVDTIL